jgi:hypothetical protein
VISRIGTLFARVPQTARKKTWLTLCHLFTVTLRVFGKFESTADAATFRVSRRSEARVVGKDLVTVVIC